MHFVQWFKLSPSLSPWGCHSLAELILALEDTKFSFPKMCALIMRVVQARLQRPICFLTHCASPVETGPGVTMVTMDIYVGC